MQSDRTLRATKRSLLALSHAMERSLDVRSGDGPRNGAPLVLGMFQRRHYFEVERERYARMAREGTLCIVGFRGSPEPLPDGVVGVFLDAADPLSREWSVIVLDGHLGISLVAHDVDDIAPGEQTLEAGRLFDARWSFNTSVAAGQARRLLREIASHLDGETYERAEAAIESACDAHLSEAEIRLSAVTELLITSIDQAHTRAAILSEELRVERLRAESDHLTGLHNRYFLDRYLHSPEDETPVTVAAMLIDLDDLKSVNDEHGHLAGDAAISAVADVLRDSTRPQDVIARVGGDEFLVLLPGRGTFDAVAVGERIVAAVAAIRLPDPWGEARLGASIGVAIAPRNAVPVAELDSSLYEAKRQGKGRVKLHQ